MDDTTSYVYALMSTEDMSKMIPFTADTAKELIEYYLKEGNIPSNVDITIIDFHQLAELWNKKEGD